MHIDIFQYCYFLRTMLQVMASLILTLLFACSETVHNNNQEDHTTLMSANDVGGDSIGQQIDPLFFLPGQLCQHVRRIYQDQQDNLWMGTNVYHIMRYNGDTLQYFGEESNFDGGRITGILEDSAGNLWMSAYGGLFQCEQSQLSSQQPKFKHYGADAGLQDEELWCLFIDSKGVFWVGHNQGVAQFDGIAFKTFSMPRASVKNPKVLFSADRITAIVEDKQGNIWLGTDGFGLTRFDGKTFEHFTIEDGLCDNSINELLVDAAGNIWVGTFFGGLSMFDGTGFINFTQEGIIEGVEVGGLWEDSSGAIWFAVEHNGVFRYDGKSALDGKHLFTHYRAEDPSYTNGILCIYKDRQDRFWFGGWGGLFRYDNQRFLSVTRQGPWLP